MDSDTGEDERPRGDEAGEEDLATILSYLVRSGQVRLMSSYDEREWETDSDEEVPLNPRLSDCSDTPQGIPDPNPDTSALETSSLKQELLQGTCKGSKNLKRGLPQVLLQRELGVLKQQKLSLAHCCHINCDFLPNASELVDQLPQKQFCGTYSNDGSIFLSACQDRCLRIYDTSYDRFLLMKRIRARDVGWSVLDTAFSPDGNYLAYSSWSDCMHLCNVRGEHEVHEPLPLQPNNSYSFAIFSMQFSSDNEEILGGANDGNLYIYDRQSNQRILRVDAHEDDVNAVCFADESSQIVFSGGDDGLVKVWDRRTLSEADPKPVGILAGHMDGITFIDTRGDSRYLLSNSKDQCIKLWDMRNFSSRDTQERTRMTVANTHWDYRWQPVPKKARGKRQKLAGDTSLMSYYGHTVQHTLIRARFSPRHTTGGRYIYTGCASGAIIIYDVLTGQVVKTLRAQKACVRDVSWHPDDNKITSTSWDGSLRLWSYQSPDDHRYFAPRDSASSSSDEHEDEDDRTRRLRQRRAKRDPPQPRKGLGWRNRLNQQRRRADDVN